MIIGDTFMRVTEDTVRKLGLKADRVFLAQVSRNTNTRTHARTHARARAYTHTHTHMLSLSLPLATSLSPSVRRARSLVRALFLVSGFPSYFSHVSSRSTISHSARIPINNTYSRAGSLFCLSLSLSTLPTRSLPVSRYGLL